MDWLSKLHDETLFRYRNSRTDEVICVPLSLLEEWLNISIKGEPGEEFYFAGDRYTYAGFEPRKLNIMTKITFEKNGRKALKIKDADGQESIRSMSKENYLKGKGTKSVLTKACKEASNKEKLKILRRTHAQWTKGA